jgi:hypothetical protein
MSGSNWWVTSFPANASGGAAQGAQGGSVSSYTADSGFYRNRLDAIRAGANQGPTAQYPDGYLGTIIDRRQDRLVSTIQNRLTDRSYQRGVHKGEKIGANSYFWSDEVSPDQGLERQAMSATPEDVEGGEVIMVQRYAPLGNPVEKLVHMGKTAMMSAPEQERVARQYGVDVAKNPLPMMQSDPDRAKNLRSVLPRWSGVYRAS